MMFGACPLYSQKRTLTERAGMSALCQKRTQFGLEERALLRCVIAQLVQRLRKRRRRWRCLGAVARVDCLVQVISGVIRQPEDAACRNCTALSVPYDTKPPSRT